jgi:hypothetical protein
MLVDADAVSLRLNEVADHRLQRKRIKQMTDRLAQLEAQALALNAEIAKLKAERPAPAPPPPRDEVRILQVLAERGDGLPSFDQMRKLFSIVRHRVPEQKSPDPDSAFRGFCASYRYVFNCGRIAAPNAKVSITWFIDGMKTWLRERNAMTIDVSGSSFIAAVLASGDILYVPHDSAVGHVWEFSLVLPPNHGGKPASDAWKRVLNGSVMAPSQPARRDLPLSPVRIVSGW